MNDLNLNAIVLVTCAALLAAFFVFLYRQKQQQFLLVWVAGWLVISGHLFAFEIDRGSGSPWFEAVDFWLLAAGVLTVYAAALLYARRKLVPWTLITAAAVVAIWCLAHPSRYWKTPITIGAGALLVVIGRIFWQEGHKQESQADKLIAGTFQVWALLYAAVTIENIARPASNLHLLPLTFLPLLSSGVFMVAAVYEEERRHLERNMLALSNLNLATSSFVGGEIQKMLAQALDRILNVVRIPSGALCMHYGETKGPTSVVVTGLDDSFCSAVQINNLDEYAVNLVARLGGIIVLSDLKRDSKFEALEKEELFRQLRQLFLGLGLETVVGISLQSKHRVFGVMLLGTEENRAFSAGELRLLVGLGHQIGMSIENSYLVQQTSRRSEELNFLNEIGRALSSTLDLQALWDRIYIEMRNLMTDASFYIATCDDKNKQVRFEIEIERGERMPKRSRPMGDHLVEYVVATRQPVLIREHLAEESQRRGFRILREAGSICAVPLLLQDSPVGVLALHSRKEQMFDQGHAEMLKVLASEASIAIENARLFSEEQKKSRQLTLINAVSRHAIESPQPQEMLAKIAEEIAKSLTYDHVGIAILDYSTKELIVQAEAGDRREAANRRIPLGEGLVGQVARSGQTGIVREVNLSTPRMVLPDSASSVALPVVYAENLLGVLYVESVAACDFPEQEVQLLRTLADLFAGALHNALTLQKTQEQAITDGLTGVKTHRFLMEALSAEWKRSTRSNRTFSIVLMDLDRFKFVNDFYGHLEGDVILQRVGHILEQNCRRSDVVARYGGDEFVILMPETGVEQARQLAAKLRSWVASDPLLRDKNITASFGVAGFPVHGATPQELIQVADSSMYLSKHQGGNAVSTAEQSDPKDRKRWKKDVLEAYLGVTLKRLFATGPEAFEEIYRRLEQFTRSLEQNGGDPADGLPPAVVETVTSLALAIDAKDHYTQGHSQKVSAYAVMLAQALGMSTEEVEEVRLGGLLHDIGKVGIPEPILNKSGPLDTTEWETMKTHTELGAKILEPLKSMSRIRLMVRHHHEFYDGSGYPDRLSGENIPYGARLVSVADAYDTITSARTYKKPRTSDDAFAELERCAGNQFDPEIVRIFIDVLRRAPRPTIEAAPALVTSDTASARAR